MDVSESRIATSTDFANVAAMVDAVGCLIISGANLLTNLAVFLVSFDALVVTGLHCFCNVGLALITCDVRGAVSTNGTSILTGLRVVDLDTKGLDCSCDASNDAS